MKYSINLISADSAKYEAPVYWLRDKYYSCEEIWPEWGMARALLTEFVERTEFEWKITSFPNDPSRINVGFVFPNMLEIFPPEVKDKVVEICLKLMNDYSVDLNEYLGMLKNRENEDRLLRDLNLREQFILRQGGFRAEHELRIRLGLGRKLDRPKIDQPRFGK